MTTIGIIGAGSVGRALGRGLTRAGHQVLYGVRQPEDARHGDLDHVAAVDVAARAPIVLLTIPADAVGNVVPSLGLTAGQTLVDVTNAVRTPIPAGFDTLGAYVASLATAGVAIVKAFNTIGAEHLADGHFGDRTAFLPIAGDATGVEAVLPLAEQLGFGAVVLGGREAFGLVEAHAALWIHLAFRCGWSRSFGFVAVGR
jgi:8-hydroxy-5-deazaflavin:NADPH oxidoreductase